MKHYDDPTSPEGLRLPYSGFIVGRLADALRLKAALREDFEGVSYKTVQRYFAGSRIEPESVELILDASVDALVPGDLTLGKGFIEEFPLGLIVRSALKNYARHWDRMAARVNSHMFAVTQPRDLPMPVLRLVALDLGVRVGGWAALRFLMDAPIVWETTLLAGGGLRRFIDERRERLGLTVSKLAESVNVSDQTVEAWRSASSLPTSSHIEALSKTLAGDELGRHKAEYTLRVIVAVEQIMAELKDVIGEDRLDDLIQGITSTAREVETIQRRTLSIDPSAAVPLSLMFKWDDIKAMVKKQMLRGALWELPVHGARCPIGESTTAVLVEQAKWRPEAAADFAVLAGDWTPRIMYWMSHVGSAEQSVEFMRKHAPGAMNCSVEDVEMIARAIIEGTLALGNMFWQPEPNAQWAVFQPPPFGKAMNRLAQSRVASSTGDFETAIQHLRHAVKHRPQDASLHFSLGAALWQAAFERDDLAGVEEGLLECRVAVQLDPEFGNARNEIGVILSNLRRHEEAEGAFAEAEPYHGHHNHHWYCRANNYLALKRLDDARIALIKAIERTPHGAHVDAKVRLAATLMALGKKREAQNLGKQVEHVLGIDPSKNWQQWLDPWASQRWPRAVAHDQVKSGSGDKVGRNERCPCGSGRKFKHCCGR